MDLQRHMSWPFLCSVVWDWVIVRFLNIGGIVTHHCLNLIFITTYIYILYTKSFIFMKRTSFQTINILGDKMALGWAYHLFFMAWRNKRRYNRYDRNFCYKKKRGRLPITCYCLSEPAASFLWHSPKHEVLIYIRS